MLDLNTIDLEGLASALRIRSGGDHGWWLDPASGEVVQQADPGRELVAIEAIPAGDATEAMEEFVGRVHNPRVREPLERAAAAGPSLERFEEALAEFPGHRDAWLKFRDARMKREAIDWLARAGVVDRDAVFAESLAWEAVAQGAIQKVGELAGLIRFLQPRKLRTVVEIGTARGGTLYVWCAIAEPDALIVSIDLPDADDTGGVVRKTGWGRFGYEEAEIPRFRSFAKDGQALHLLRSDSHLPATLAELESVLGRRKVDFLIIDGDHSYEGVKEDFLLYSPLVEKGGVIAFHDVLPHTRMPECEVDRLWQELKPLHRHVEFLEPEVDWGFGQWGGIGVLFW